MQLSAEIKTSLAREHALCSNALLFYQKALKAFEDKYHLTTRTFLKKFEAGEMGDEADFFDWYAFANLYSQWRKTHNSLASAIQ